MSVQEKPAPPPQRQRPAMERVRSSVQRFGGHLSGMVMPNIGAFIAWGLITALFIPTGWWPNETLAQLVDPMIGYLLPILIGYTGGRLVHGQRGAVVGAVATVGVVVGTDTPMFLGAMVIGPLTAYLMKLFDRTVRPHVRSGFEMLVDNFSAGILGGIMALIGLVSVGPVVESITGVLGQGVQALMDARLLPLVSILVEPAKVLFLNNAINHGVLGPLAIAESTEAGQAIQFLIEPNPGPGLGILLACMFFGSRATRATAPGAAIIQFFGGIHEIYFPYILAQPRLILAAIGGGASGILVFLLTGAGLVASPSPGSIIAVMAVTPRGGHVGVLAGVAAATIVSFLIASALLGFGRGKKAEDDADTAEQGPATAGDGESAGAAADATDTDTAAEGANTINGAQVGKVVVACDAGMGSSALLTSTLTKKLAAYSVGVSHTSVDRIPDDADVVLVHANLAERARRNAPGKVVLTFQAYLGDPVFDRLEKAIKEGQTIDG
ncbi:PTS mannitol transporter subunit IICB [Nocardiopsis mangrovi]|uniref:PTS mannitol transporter subunit IICB n=1 Tax=Nocardiopsis mangrovi TaxID=1179818 RepID=A0ABV9E4X0_9ACTN